jgi:hypothetical protein
MAIARCKTCGKPRANKPPQYDEVSRLPAGFPKSGIVCGSKGCDDDALVWLKADEAELYKAGQRVFDLRTNSAKVRLE